jgi:hypothetical protein
MTDAIVYALSIDVICPSVEGWNHYHRFRLRKPIKPRLPNPNKAIDDGSNTTKTVLDTFWRFD